MDDLETYFAAVRSTNPFVDNRVNGLSADEVDVHDIHRAAFERLTTLAGEACSQRRGLGAMLLGEAGTGKSHLLSRLLRWAARDKQAITIYLHNLQASPENLPRSILKAVVSILTRGKVRCFIKTPLFDMAFDLLKEALRFDPTKKYLWPFVERAYRRLIDGLSAEDPSRAALVNRTVYDVLYRFFHSAYRIAKTRDDHVAGLAVRWLSGDYLDPAEATQLGLPPSRDDDEPSALADNQQIKQVLVALSRMALSRKQPFILCFDQVDNLDDEQAAALARFLEALIDSAPNLLVVMAGIQSSMLRWRELRVFQDSAWDRLAQFEIALHRLTPQESRRIIAARLEKITAPFVELPPVRQRRQEDDLFPLGQAWAEEFFRDRIDLRPREAIKGAFDGWQREQETLKIRGGPDWLEEWGRQLHVEPVVPPPELSEEQIRAAIDSKVSQKIAAHRELKRQQPDTLPPDAANLAGVIATLLRHLDDLTIELPQFGSPDRAFPYSLVVRRQAGDGVVARIGVRCLADGSALSTTKALRFLVEASPHPEQTLLVTEERSPLVFGVQPTAKGRQYYAELNQQKQGQFQHLQMTFEEYAHLDALQAVVGMAKSGDLEIDLPGGKTRQVSEEEVIASHVRRERYGAVPVLRELLTEPAFR